MLNTLDEERLEGIFDSLPRDRLCINRWAVIGKHSKRTAGDRVILAFSEFAEANGEMK
jgi:hypothetical protein